MFAIEIGIGIFYAMCGILLNLGHEAVVLLGDVGPFGRDWRAQRPCNTE